MPASNLDDLLVIRTYFAANWDDSIPVVYDNDVLTAETQGLWARFSVKPGFQSIRSFLPRSYNQQGRVYLQIFAPRETTDQPAWQVAEAFAATFRDLDLDNYRVRFTGPEFRTADPTDTDPYYMVFCTIPYRAIH